MVATGEYYRQEDESRRAILVQKQGNSNHILPSTFAHKPEINAQRLQERKGHKNYGSDSSTKSHYEQLVEKELNNPIVCHSFDPIGSKFGKENSSTNLGAKPGGRPRGKAKVIVKSTLFPVNVTKNKD